jgi:hypothetical protein
MVFATRTLILASALLLPLSLLGADVPADPSGHWEGAIHVPSGEVQIEVDLAFDDGGKLVGTFSNASEHLTGYPLWNVTVDGASISLEIKTGGSGVQTFAGNLAADGKSMSGDFLVSVYAVPFNLTRTGEARIEAPPSSSAIDNALAGAWSASLDIGGKPLPLVLTMTNHADGTATGNWALDDGVATPVAITHEGRNVTLASTVANAAYSGTVSADGMRISGSFTGDSLDQPLTFSRNADAR